MNSKSIFPDAFLGLADPTKNLEPPLCFKQKAKDKPKHNLTTRALTGAGALLITLSVGLSQPIQAAVDNDALRAAAPPRLTLADVPDMQPMIDYYFKDEGWALILGKALFWDTQVGGDEVQACASCHFQTGADPRSINQLSPGLIAGDVTFQAKGGGAGGPNYPLSVADFPFFDESPDGRDDNDVVSSMGVFLRNFLGFTPPPGPPGPADCESVPDPVFNINTGVGGPHNTRRVEPRNTPTVINAMLKHRVFLDGRANNFYNGVNPLGLRGQLIDVNAALPNIADPTDPTNRDVKKAVWEYSCDNMFFGFCFAGHLDPRWPLHQPGALASQANGPPESFFEMSCGENRGFNDIGRLLQQRRPLKNQVVHSNDDVFGPLGPHGNQVAADNMGLTLTYDQLIRRAIQDRWHAGIGLIPDDGDAATDYTQIEENFSVYFGSTVQLYESILIANQTPFDAFARPPDGSGLPAGDNTAMTEDQKEGLEVFLSEEGRCIFCHAGTEFTGASFVERAIEIDMMTGEPINGEGEPMERMIMGDGLPAVYDGGYYNIGARPTADDGCVGGTTAGVPVSYARQAAEGPRIDPESRVDAAGDDEDPTVLPGPVMIGMPGMPGEPIAVDGACGVPTLRMAAFTAPYFHAGQVAELHEAVRLYKDQFTTLFSLENIDDLDPDILEIEVTDVEDPGIEIGGGDVNRITTFIAEALTDPRAVDESGVFSHPELCFPNGHPEPNPGNGPDRPLEATDDIVCTPAVGAQGRAADGLPPIVPFLGIDQADF